MTEFSNIKDIQNKWTRISDSFSSASSFFKKIKIKPILRDDVPVVYDKEENQKTISGSLSLLPDKALAEKESEPDIAPEKSQDDKKDPSLSLGSDWDFLFKNEELLSVSPEEERVVLIDEADLDQEDEINEELISDAVEELEELMPEIKTLLNNLQTKNDNFQELYRLVHTLKGVLGSVGAKKARSIVHVMENAMEEWDNIEHNPEQSKSQLIDLFFQADVLIQPLISGEWVKDKKKSESQNPEGQNTLLVSKPPRTVRVQADSIDRMVSDINEGRLLSMALDEAINFLKLKIKDLEENAQHVSKMSKDLELQAEIQIQSKKTQTQENAADFDPLEFDRFTRLQELARTIGEGVTDVLEIRRELSKITMDQEAIAAQQKTTIQSTQEKLRKTRLTPADAINDRLHNVVWTAAKESDKEVFFKMTGSRVELDRVLLEKIIPPLEHILRNSVVHGIESPNERLKNNKSSTGNIHININQRSDRVLIDVVDDGLGLNVEKIRQKAIERGLWDSSMPMEDKDAAEIICSQGFSTVDNATNLAGRGVGMDVVRSQILSLGGRFEIVSVFGKGMEINIQLPTSVATSSILLVNSGGEKWAFSIEIVEHVALLSKDEIKTCRESNLFNSSQFSDWNNSPFYRLDDLTGIKSRTLAIEDNAPVLLIRERGQLMAIEVSSLVQVFEVPLRPSGSIWNDVDGVAGTVILPNGNAIFLLDPFRFTSFDNQSIKSSSKEAEKQSPLIMIVDDSLTVRKASARFLTKNGFENVQAKDGQEALELLDKITPSVILLDIEMPRMDGFDCLKNIRENPQHKDIPVIMITSRTADKHKKYAFSLGANEYLGKPFKDSELLSLLREYISKPTSHSK